MGGVFLDALRSYLTHRIRLGPNIRHMKGFKALNGPFEEFTALNKDFTAVSSYVHILLVF